MQTRNHKKREVDLSQQSSHDAEPFRIQWLPAHGLACPAIPVRSVALIAFLAMQIGVARGFDMKTKKDRERYSLTSAAKPHIADGGKDIVQAEILYKCLEPYGSIYTLEQLIVAAKKRNYESTFKHEKSATVRESLLYHLNRFKKSGFVRVVEGTPDSE